MERERTADTESREAIKRQEHRNQESERYSGFESERLKETEREASHSRPERGDQARRSAGAESNANISAGFGSHGGFYHTDENTSARETIHGDNRTIDRTNAGCVYAG